jgi:hypothetical protein
MRKPRCAFGYRYGQAIGHPAESVNDEQNPDYPVDISRSANQVAQQNEMDSENDEAD